jgi:hypothetical protein
MGASDAFQPLLILQLRESGAERRQSDDFRNVNRALASCRASFHCKRTAACSIQSGRATVRAWPSRQFRRLAAALGGAHDFDPRGRDIEEEPG